jgi:hypothetical protein
MEAEDTGVLGRLRRPNTPIYHLTPAIPKELKQHYAKKLIVLKMALRTFAKTIVEPFFECVRLRRTHSKNELLLNFRIDTNSDDSG